MPPMCDSPCWPARSSKRAASASTMLHRHTVAPAQALWAIQAQAARARTYWSRATARQFYRCASAHAAAAHATGEKHNTRCVLALHTGSMCSQASMITLTAAATATNCRSSLRLVFQARINYHHQCMWMCLRTPPALHYVCEGGDR